MGAGPSPLPEMTKATENLEKAGVDLIIIPCVTAHYYYEELKERVKVPVLNIVKLTAQAIREKFPDVKKVGVIAMTGTVLAGMYNQALARKGIRVAYPSEEFQDKVMEAIYDVKAGRIPESKKIVVKVTTHLIEKGVEIIIFGCTEIPLVLKSQEVSVPIVDPLQILAERAVAIALRRGAT